MGEDSNTKWMDFVREYNLIKDAAEMKRFDYVSFVRQPICLGGSVC